VSCRAQALRAPAAAWTRPARGKLAMTVEGRYSSCANFSDPRNPHPHFPSIRVIRAIRVCSFREFA
jgi:hypothetical protein